MINSIVPAVRSFATVAAPVAKTVAVKSAVFVAKATVVMGMQFGTLVAVTALERRYLRNRPVVNHTPSGVSPDLNHDAELGGMA